MYVVWALGRLDENNEPNFHDYYPKSNLMLDLGRKNNEGENKDNNENENRNICVGFTANNDKLRLVLYIVYSINIL